MATAINRWQPARSLVLQNTFDRLLDESLVRPFSLFSSENGARSLPLDVFEHDDAFVVRAFVPGVTPDQLDITAQRNSLTSRAQQADQEQQHVPDLLRERTGGAWFGTIELPAAFDASHVEAKLEHGVLGLTLPKTPGSKPHRIRISTQ
jgi:HSP20 family protein